MHSSAFGAAALTAFRNPWSAARLSGLKAARYSSMVLGFGTTACAPEQEARNSSAFRLRLSPSQRRRQNLRKPVVTRRHAMLHGRPEHRVANRFRRVEHSGRGRGLSVLLDEYQGVHGLTFVPGLVENLGAYDPLGRHDLAIDAAHRHPGAV